MGTLVGVTPKAVTVQGFQFESYQDMLDALSYLSTLQQPYTGSLNCQIVDSAMTWWLTLVNPHGVGGTGYINDWVILENNTNAHIVRAVDFDTFYALA